MPIPRGKKCIVAFFSICGVYGQQTKNSRILELRERLTSAGINYQADSITGHKQKSVCFLTGGEYRGKYEIWRNPQWGDIKNDQLGYYSQRLTLHGNLVLTKKIRWYGELISGIEIFKRSRPLPVQNDHLDILQNFIELSTSLGRSSLQVKIGRQHLFYGSGGLIGIREGPNIRRSFDGVKLSFTEKNASTDIFYTKEVQINPGTFDNDTTSGPLFFGIYHSTGKAIDFYYLNFRLRPSTINKAKGPEKRQTLGIRFNHQLLTHFNMASEFNYQYGKSGDIPIRAWSVTNNFYYKTRSSSGIHAGLKIDYFSGDKSEKDNLLHSFNPLFNTPSYHSLLASVAAVNLFDVHPYAILSLPENKVISFDWTLLWRARKKDGLYIPIRSFGRNGLDSKKHFLGNEFTLAYHKKISSSASVSVYTHYFITGDFFKETGNGKNIFNLKLMYKVQW